jgi:hypothetical protein
VLLKGIEIECNLDEEVKQDEDSLKNTCVSVDKNLFDQYFFDEQYEDSSLLIENQLVNKIEELYVEESSKYVLLRKTRNYETVIWNRYNKKLNMHGAKPLLPFMLKAHLKGWYTICVFASSMSTIFICFDVDISGNNKKKKAQKAVRLLINTLVEYGIPKDRIYTSWSGKKGYHVEIFFNDRLFNYKAKEFFEIIVNRPGLNNILEGKIEFRPTSTQAIKIPLGINFCNLRKKDSLCCFVDIHSGEEFENINDDQYFLDIQQIDPMIIDNAIAKHDGSNGNIKHNLSNRNSSTANSSNPVKCKNEIIQETSSLSSQINPEPYRKGMSVKSALKLESEGLKQPGTRHNSLLELAILFKEYYRYSREETEKKLIEWFKKQDEHTYTTSLKDTISDIEKITKYTYERDYKLRKSSHAVKIFDLEMKEVIKVKQKNGKLLLFALLVHNKKHSVLNGVFYMTYEHMSNAVGLDKRTCINQMKNLVKQNFVELVEKTRGSNKLNNPNKYKLLLGASLRETDQDCKVMTFEYNNNENIREYYLRGLEMIDSKILKEFISDKGYHLLMKGNYL